MSKCVILSIRFIQECATPPHWSEQLDKYFNLYLWFMHWSKCSPQWGRLSNKWRGVAHAWSLHWSSRVCWLRPRSTASHVQTSRRQLIPLFDKPAFSRFSQKGEPRFVVEIIGKIVKRQVCQKRGMSCRQLVQTDTLRLTRPTPPPTWFSSCCPAGATHFIHRATQRRMRASSHAV